MPLTILLRGNVDFTKSGRDVKRFGGTVQSVIRERIKTTNYKSFFQDYWNQNESN
jgi:hypothetical protein